MHVKRPRLYLETWPNKRLDECIHPKPQKLSLLQLVPAPGCSQPLGLIGQHPAVFVGNWHVFVSFHNMLWHQWCVQPDHVGCYNIYCIYCKTGYFWSTIQTRANHNQHQKCFNKTQSPPRSNQVFTILIGLVGLKYPIISKWKRNNSETKTSDTNQLIPWHYKGQNK